MAGVTGTKAVPEDEVRAAMMRVRAATNLPCTVGFGIRSPEQADAIAKVADGVVVGSAIVSKVAANLDLSKEDGGRAKVIAEVLTLTEGLPVRPTPPAMVRCRHELDHQSRPPPD